MPSSLIDFKDWSLPEIEKVLSLSLDLKKRSASSVGMQKSSGSGIGLASLFFEASTRTRLSFELAAIRAGFQTFGLEGASGSSMEKGESVEETIRNVAAMGPDLMIIRCGDSVPLRELIEDCNIKILNAGWGVKAHPSQALLDALTLKEKFGELKGRRLLIVGDIRHSRVASSHLELLPKLGIEVAICGPSLFTEGVKAKSFSQLAEGIEWADAVMALRVQFERHGSALRISNAEYATQYGLSPMTVVGLKKTGAILHPGPINFGIEMLPEIMQDPRCLVYKQVQNGVFVREALLRTLVGEST